MGLGKTFLGSVKLAELNAPVNLLVCQKSKITDWIEHFESYHPEITVFDCTGKRGYGDFINASHGIGVINYDLVFRRSELLKLTNFTLMLDESSIIQNEASKRSKAILKMNPVNVILLSGTPCSGKYEKLWSQLKLLGWKISKTLFWSQYVEVVFLDVGGFPVRQIVGYKNVDRLKSKLREYGAVFMKSDEVFNLPEQTDIVINVKTTTVYKQFMKNSIITIEDITLVGDTTLTKRLYARQLCGQYNDDKLQAFADLVESTEDRLIVFYNFDEELERMQGVVNDRPTSIVNGKVKDLTAYENEENSITFVQYQAGAKGLNLQKATKIIYFTLTQSCEDWMQSKKRIHRIGQKNTCFYYYLMCRDSVEEKVLKALKSGRDYTDKLFEGDFE